MERPHSIQFSDVPTKLGSQVEVPVSFELTITRTRPKGRNVAQISIGGEDFFIEPGKTVLQLK